MTQEEDIKITADSYQRVASIGGWGGGGRTLWAISALGGALGAAIGLAAPFFPLLVVGTAGLPAAMSALGASVATFTAAGISTGFAGGLMLGRISGAAASVAQEQEKRLKEWTARQMLHQNPNAEIIPDPPPEKDPPKPFLQRMSDSYHTYFNPRVGLTMALIGAVGGLVMAAAFIATGGASGALMPALGVISGLGAETFAAGNIAANAGVISAYFAGVMASFGALWSFNIPQIASSMTHFFGELISGKPLGREWGPKTPEKLRSPTQAYYNQDVTISDGQVAKPRPRTFASFQDLVSQTQDPTTHVTR